MTGGRGQFPKLPTILVVPNVRPSQDGMVQRYKDCGDDHYMQTPCHELLEGMLEGVLEEIQLEGVREEALECALGEVPEEALEETDTREGTTRAPG